MPYNKVNVIIVGDAKTGKTSLIRRSSKKGGKSPHNIIMHTFEYSPSANATAVTFKVWDFPRQVCNYKDIFKCVILFS